MGISIVWPSFWLTAALFVACLVFVLQFFGKSKVKMIFRDSILLNVKLVDILGLVLFFIMFVSTLYLINCCKFETYDMFGRGCCYFLYFVLLACALTLAGAMDSQSYDKCLPMSFFCLAPVTGSALGLIFMAILHFSYMWYMLGILVLGVILALWRDYIYKYGNDTKYGRSSWLHW
ncbi:MAG: hypothetical protein J6B00_02605 [Alphaproteobacteria bacterium]|nr:hypothetical protein [Alphaproteobacteria bacterium]MBO5441908.1 hypothetical protein [Alphaproteobacteria bacterium]